MDEKTKIRLKQLSNFKKNIPFVRLAAEEWNSDWKKLISILLSARTRDEVTIRVAKNLFNKYKSIEKLSNANLKEVQKIIKSINFYKNKSRNIIECTKLIIKEHNSKVPKNLDELIKLPGVGRKTANVFLAEKGYNTIGVDTHVAYISKKMKWTKSIKPEIIEKDLEKLFPKKYWKNLNSILVRFGKTHTSRKEKDKIILEIKKVK